MDVKVTCVFFGVDYDELMQELIDMGADNIEDEEYTPTPDNHVRQPKRKKNAEANK